MRRSSRVIASVAIAGSLFGAGAGAASVAMANGATVTTTTHSETLISPRCYHYHSITLTYRHWSSAAHRYISYPNGPRRTVTDYDKCHA